MDGDRTIIRKVTWKVKWMDWGVRCLGYVGNCCSQCCVCCAWIKGVLLTLTLWYLAIMLWSWILLYLYMYTCTNACHCLTARCWGSWFFYANVYMYICMYVCCFLIGSLEIILVEEWLLMQVNGTRKSLLLWGIKWEEYQRQIYEVIIMSISIYIVWLFYVYVYAMEGNVEGYISGMKAV